MSMSEPRALRPRVAILPPGSVPGVYPYAPMGAPAISLESTPMSGALALKLALKLLDGDKDVPKETVIPLQGRPFGSPGFGRQTAAYAMPASYLLRSTAGSPRALITPSCGTRRRCSTS